MNMEVIFGVVYGGLCGLLIGWFVGFHRALDGLEEENKRLKERLDPSSVGATIINNLCAEIEKDMKYPAADREKVCSECNEAYVEAGISVLPDEVRQEWIKDHLWLGYIAADEERGE